MLDAIQQIIASFSRVSSQAAGNWAEEFARNRLIPLLEHLPFVPAGVAEHFPVSLGTILRGCLEPAPFLPPLCRLSR